MKEFLLPYLTDELSDSEFEQLQQWLKEPENLREFQRLIKENFNVSMVYETRDVDTALLNVKRMIQAKEKPAKKMFWPYVAAASVVLLFSLSLIFKNNIEQVTPPPMINNNIKIGTDKATLTLENGTEITLEKGTRFNKKNLESNGEEIIYKPIDNSTTQIAYNYLTIPRGGQYHLKLSDGTEVWLNSESKLKYPTSFIAGKDRTVELLYGEAYFDVSPSEDHQGAKFSVHSGAQQLEVLGTKFNVKAYKEETYIYTTLVEGKVAVSNGTEKNILAPSQQIKMNTLTKDTQITYIEDIINEIGWVQGDFVFTKTPLKNIVTVLSRWYDVDIIIGNKAIENNKFNGHLSKNQNIEEILKLIKKTNFINTYEINENTITLK